MRKPKPPHLVRLGVVCRTNHTDLACEHGFDVKRHGHIDVDSKVSSTLRTVATSRCSGQVDRSTLEVATHHRSVTTLGKNVDVVAGVDRVNRCVLSGRHDCRTYGEQVNAHCLGQETVFKPSLTETVLQACHCTAVTVHGQNVCKSLARAYRHKAIDGYAIECRNLVGNLDPVFRGVGRCFQVGRNVGACSRLQRTHKLCVDFAVHTTHDCCVVTSCVACNNVLIPLNGSVASVHRGVECQSLAVEVILCRGTRATPRTILKEEYVVRTDVDLFRAAKGNCVPLHQVHTYSVKNVEEQGLKYVAVDCSHYAQKLGVTAITSGIQAHFFKVFGSFRAVVFSNLSGAEKQLLFGVFARKRCIVNALFVEARSVRLFTNARGVYVVTEVLASHKTTRSNDVGAADCLVVYSDFGVVGKVSRRKNAVRNRVKFQLFHFVVLLSLGCRFCGSLGYKYIACTPSVSTLGYVDCAEQFKVNAGAARGNGCGSYKQAVCDRNVLGCRRCGKRTKVACTPRVLFADDDFTEVTTVACRQTKTKGFHAKVVLLVAKHGFAHVVVVECVNARMVAVSRTTCTVGSGIEEPRVAVKETCIAGTVHEIFVALNGDKTVLYAQEACGTIGRNKGRASASTEFTGDILRLIVDRVRDFDLEHSFVDKHSLFLLVRFLLAQHVFESRVHLRLLFVLTACNAVVCHEFCPRLEASCLVKSCGICVVDCFHATAVDFLDDFLVANEFAVFVHAFNVFGNTFVGHKVVASVLGNVSVGVILTVFSETSLDCIDDCFLAACGFLCLHCFQRIAYRFQVAVLLVEFGLQSVDTTIACFHDRVNGNYNCVVALTQRNVCVYRNFCALDYFAVFLGSRSVK
nr:MAG TPA: hypothetical protein [Caudoviricetes sp.]